MEIVEVSGLASTVAEAECHTCNIFASIVAHTVFPTDRIIISKVKICLCYVIIDAATRIANVDVIFITFIV